MPARPDFEYLTPSSPADLLRGQIASKKVLLHEARDAIAKIRTQAAFSRGGLTRWQQGRIGGHLNDVRRITSWLELAEDRLMRLEVAEEDASRTPPHSDNPRKLLKLKDRNGA